MSFKVLEKGAFTFKEALPENFCSIDRTGTARFCRQDLELVGLEDEAVILTDELGMRIALRKPRAGEKQHAYRLAVQKYGKRANPDRRAISFRRALAELHLDPKDTAGRFELTTKDDLLIVTLCDMSEASEHA